MIKTLRNPCTYNRAIFRTLDFLEPEASSKSCLTYKIIIHIYSLDIVSTVYSNAFKDILEDSRILMEIQPPFRALNQGGKGRPLLLFLKIKQCLDFGKKGSGFEVSLSKGPSSTPSHPSVAFCETLHLKCLTVIIFSTVFFVFFSGIFWHC